MADTSQIPLRIPAEDHEWLKAFIAQYPGDSLNAMLTRFIRKRIEALVADERVATPEFTPVVTSADLFAGVENPAFRE
jgi:hypothetical protein